MSDGLKLRGAAAIFYELWRSSERELAAGRSPLPANCTTRERFEAIIASLDYDGKDIDSLTVGEIRRALP